MEKILFEDVCRLWEAEKSKEVKASSLAAYSLIVERQLLPRFRTLEDITPESVQGGPIVNCMEEIDNPFDYDGIHLSKETKFTLEELPKEKWWGHSLTQIKARVSGEQTLSLIPYFAWGNRAPGKMDVFIPYIAE